MMIKFNTGKLTEINNRYSLVLDYFNNEKGKIITEELKDATQELDRELSLLGDSVLTERFKNYVKVRSSLAVMDDRIIEYYIAYVKELQKHIETIYKEIKVLEMREKSQTMNQGELYNISDDLRYNRIIAPPVSQEFVNQPKEEKEVKIEGRNITEIPKKKRYQMVKNVYDSLPKNKRTSGGIQEGIEARGFKMAKSTIRAYIYRMGLKLEGAKFGSRSEEIDEIVTTSSEDEIQENEGD